MSRRQKYNPVAQGGVSGERSSLGDNHVEKAIKTIEKWAAAQGTMMAPFPYERDHVLHWLFTDDTMEKMLAVKNLVTASSDLGSYSLKGDFGVVDMSVVVDFSGSKVPCIKHSALTVQPQRAEPLYDCIEKVIDIHHRFETVKHVLRWLNRNATPGAIRYYFPGAMQLCPESPALLELQHTPLRYSTPEGIAEQLPAIRQAASTVASAALMAEDARGKARNVSQLWLTFAQYTFRPNILPFRDDNGFEQAGLNGPTIRTDAVSYFL